jgi:hypothetical protein
MKLPTGLKSPYLTPKQLAPLVGKTSQSLANDRFLGKGLPYIKNGKSVLYHWPTVEKILHDSMVYPER